MVEIENFLKGGKVLKSLKKEVIFDKNVKSGRYDKVTLEFATGEKLFITIKTQDDFSYMSCAGNILTHEDCIRI